MSKVSKGFLWSAVDHFSVQGIQFLLSIIVARLVSPSSYGVIVMVQVFLSFAQLFIESGFKSALVQKKDRTDIDFYTVFNTNLFVALFLYFVLFACAPYIASFYEEPLLIPLTRVIALNLIFSSLSIIQLVRLQINLDFKTQAKARVVSVIVSGIVGVYCAYIGLEVWALVIQSLLSTFMTSVMLMHFSHWMPRLQFSYTSFKTLFAFGSKILFSNFFTTCYIQITNLIIGKFYTPAQLAYYNRGFTLAQLPSASLVEVISRTVFPVYCDLQDDKKNLLEHYNKFNRLSCLIVFPLLALVCVLSHPIISVVLTDRWIETAPLLSIFCLVFITYPIIANSGQILAALGKGTLIAKTTIIKRTIAFLILAVSLTIGVKAVAWGLFISNICEMLISMYCLKITTAYLMKEQFYSIVDIVFITLIAAFLSWLSSTIFLDNFLKLSVGLFVGISSYIALIFGMKMREKEWIIKLITAIKNKKNV